VNEGITVDCRTLDYSVEPCVEGDRSNGKTADFGQWCGAMRRGRKVDAEDKRYQEPYMRGPSAGSGISHRESERE